ncbi:MAG TPA: hypothetical protein DIW51_08890 [Rhodospirillaceae bacterium]|nr:hypothetical protein [Magnetovibrio sp.]HBT44324.1 hypothetical protein [Rhodospirillaceae bacterium]HCS70070.1 hypothetical protein [Rhodospirillaceae bacterium]|tara:strand:- start:582 stop:923 length:342 start_codon:yes stop_codon:yes gene_type:complete
MPRRKPRMPCPVVGCATPIIHDHLMCRGCWMSLPVPVRKAHLRHWRAVREFLNQAWAVRPLKTREEYFRYRDAAARHNRSCALAVGKAGRIRRALGLAPGNIIEHELKDMGLL